MFQRPLIPILISFAGGILAGHEILGPAQGFLLPLFLSLAVSLLGILTLPSRFKMLCFLIMFFLSGALLDLKRYPSSQLLSLATQLREVTIEGTVLRPIKVTLERTRLRLRAHWVFRKGGAAAVNEDIIVTIYDHPPELRPGEKIRLPARLRSFRTFNNPGRYDYESAMRLKGLTCAAYVSDGRYIVPMGPGDLPFPLGLLEKVQGPVRDFLRKRLGAQDYALYRALILGERQGVSNEQIELFNRTGLGHVLAVSGLHIGLVAWLAFFLIKWTLCRSYRLALKTDIRKLTALLTCIPVIGYTFLAGFHVSAQRAMIMALVFLWSLVLGREKEIWSTLALAGLVILALDPHGLFSISFQFSFCAVIGILWLTPTIFKKLPLSDDTHPKKNRPFNRILVYFIGLIVVSLSATLFLIPFTSFYFHRVSLVTVPANVTVIPILGLWVIPLGLLSVVALPFSHQAAGFFLHLGAWGLDVIMEIIRAWASLSWSSFWVITPNLLEIVMFYFLIFSIFFFKRWQCARIGLLLTVICIFIDLGYWFHRVSLDQNLRVTFLDVGNGNSALVAFPGGEKMLIDAGGFPRDYFDVGKMVVAPYLWHCKIRRIDYLVLSHPQSDHMNGLRFIAKAFHPKEFWWNGDRVKTPSFLELMDIVKKEGIKKFLPADLEAGRQINGVKIRILHPRPGEKSGGLYEYGTRLNNNSLVLKISFKGKSFLFPGDLEHQGEEVLISNAGHTLKSDILLAPHHGSRNSSSPGFLRRVRPNICVISSGGSSPLGSSHDQTVVRLRGMGCRVFKTSREGAIQFSVGPDELEINTFLKGQAP